jgi:tRNA (Thr-GGU) A37 N-methylase
MPIQPNGARGIPGTVEIFEEFRDGLKDSEGFPRLVLIYSFHRCQSHHLTITPFLDTIPRGGVCHPGAPSPEPDRVFGRGSHQGERNNLDVEDMDILDGTPLLDLKPYVPVFD